MYVRIWGAGGAGSINSTGGHGAYVSKNISISGNSSHYIRVRVGYNATGPHRASGGGSMGGCVGFSCSVGAESGAGGIGYGDEAAGGVGGGAGGGLSGIANGTVWILIAGSGGGAGGGVNASGGNGGCLVGQMGSGFGPSFAEGNVALGGYGGSQVAGGTGGTCDACLAGSDGFPVDTDLVYGGGWGGDGSTGEALPSAGGGGGGAGWYGGGGGAGPVFNYYISSAGGGGGGSSLFAGGGTCIATVRQVSSTQNGGYCGHAGQGGRSGLEPISNSYPGRVTFTYQINNCLTNPCQNNGTCLNGVGSFLCLCPLPYFGLYCTIVDLCSESPCLNGGTCTSLPGPSYSCSCATHFAGAQCENGCSGHGTLVNGLCLCDEDRVGEFCEFSETFVNCTRGQRLYS